MQDVSNESESTPLERPKKRGRSNFAGADKAEHTRMPKRRKAVGGLRPANSSKANSPEPQGPRKLQSSKYIPQRSQRSVEGYSLQPSTLNGLIEGIWSRIYENAPFNPKEVRRFLGHVAPFDIDSIS